MHRYHDPKHGIREAVFVTDKDLRKLNRAELLELLILQTKHMDEMELQLTALQEQLKERTIHLSESGTLAEAALRLNNVFRDADQAAAQYVESARINSERQMAECADAVAKTQSKIAEMVREAEQTCEAKHRAAEAYRIEVENECAYIREEAEKILVRAEERYKLRKQEIDEYAAMVYGKLRRYVSEQQNRTDEANASTEEQE